MFASQMEGKARGIEMWGSYQATPRWRLSAGMTALHQRFWLKPGSTDTNAARAGKDPSHTAQLRSNFDLGAGKELELALRKVGTLANPAVPGYAALDARFGWRLRRDLALSLSGRNLNGAHGEFTTQAFRTEVGRQLALKLVWQH